MGLGRRAAIAARLLGRGWSAHTPAAIVWAASRAEGSTWRGTLGALAAADIQAEASASEPDAPGTIVIGAVVSLAEALAPAASHPLTAAGGSR
jgi:siroheme synthase